MYIKMYRSGDELIYYYKNSFIQREKSRILKFETLPKGAIALDIPYPCTEEFIECVFEIENISSLVKENKIEFGIIDVPCYDISLKKTKIYNNMINHEGNQLNIKFPKKEMTLAAHIINEKTTIIAERGAKIESVIFNGVTYQIFTIENFLMNIQDINTYSAVFNKNIEDAANLVLTIDDKNKFEYTIKDLIQNGTQGA